jgi:uncharacterized membrane protein YbhN (UPF0104 family)
MRKLKTDQNLIRRIIQIIGSLLSIGLFIWLLSKQNWVLVFRIVKQIPIWVIPCSLALIFSKHVVNTWRWWMLVKAQQVEISFIDTLKIVVAGAYASNFLPSTIGGDVVRIVGMLNYTHNKVVVVSSVVVDRVINMVSYLSLGPLVFLVFDIKALLGGVVQPYILVSTFTYSKWIFRIRNFGSKLIRSLISAFLLWLRTPSVVFKAFVKSWLSQLVVFIGVWILARGIQIPVSLYEVIATSVIVYVLTLLPISVNGYGLREVAVTTLYIQLGASLEQASTLAIVTRLLSMISTFPGAIWLHRDIIVESLEESSVESNSIWR